MLPHVLYNVGTLRRSALLFNNVSVYLALRNPGVLLLNDEIRNDESRRTSMVGHFVRRGLRLLVLLGILAAAYYFWREFEKPAPAAQAPPQGPVTVNVATVSAETVPVQMRFLGQTEASQVVELRARVAGYIQERLFEEGQQVEAGQPLFQIDPRPFEVELAQAQAQLSSTQATLARARQQLARAEELRPDEVVTEAQLEEAQTAVEVAAADVEQQEAAVAAAQLQLGYTTVEAPIKGMIGRVMKDVGSYVDAGLEGLLAVVQQVDPMYVLYSVTEQEILRFQRQLAAQEIVAPEVEDLELEITLADGSTYPHLGRINFVDVQMDESTGTAVIRGTVPNPENVLLPGQLVHASVLGIERVNVVRVPQDTVTHSPAGASVLVVNDEGVAESRPVTLGEWSGEDYWIIEDGLLPGERIITDHLLMVRPGSAVVVAEEAPAELMGRAVVGEDPDASAAN